MRSDHATQTNPRGIASAVRLVNTLYDIRPLRINRLMTMDTLERYVRDLFADTYNDLNDFRLQFYIDKHLRFGIYNVMIMSPQDVFEGALITVVPVSKERRSLPTCSYDYKVSHMVHSRSRFIDSNALPRSHTTSTNPERWLDQTDSHVDEEM